MENNDIRCKDHEAHVVRLRNLEEDVKEIKNVVQVLKERGWNPAVVVGIFSFFGVCFSTLGSILGIVLSAYLGKLG